MKDSTKEYYEKDFNVEAETIIGEHSQSLFPLLYVSSSLINFIDLLVKFVRFLLVLTFILTFDPRRDAQTFCNVFFAHALSNL